MEWFVRWFLKSSLVCLALGVALGVAMAIHPAWVAYRPAHAHLNLLGFVTMMIYGVAYHAIPRFAGRPLWSRRLAAVHWWLANAGLGLMVAGFGLMPTWPRPARHLLGAGAVLAAAGAYSFIVNLWGTFTARAPRGLPMLDR